MDRKLVRLLLFLLTFFGVLLGLLGPNLSYWLIFPLGIVMLVLGPSGQPAWLANALMVGSYGGYVGLTIAGTFAPTRRRLLVLYLAFVVMLGLNIAGCAGVHL